MAKKHIYGKNRNRNYSDIACVAVSEMNTTSENGFDVDMNGKPPVILTSVAGIIPNRNVLSGTVAENGGYEAGKTYLVQCTEQAYDPLYGRRFNFTKLQEITSAIEIVKVKKELGNGQIFDVNPDRPTEAELRKYDDALKAGTIDDAGYFLEDNEDAETSTEGSQQEKVENAFAE